MWLDSSIRIPELGTIVFTQLLIFDSNVPQFGRTICAFTMRLFIFIFLTTARSEDLAGCGIKHCEGITGAGGVLEASEGEWRCAGSVLEACVSGFCVEVNHRGC